MNTRTVLGLALTTLLLQAGQSISFSGPSLSAQDLRATPRPAGTVDNPACQPQSRDKAEDHTQHIEFHGAALKFSDSIRGYEVHDYVFFGVKGSQLSVRFSSRHALPILSQEDTVDLDINEVPYSIRETRCYRLRVMMMRAFSRRGIDGPYEMTLKLAPPSAMEFGDFTR